MKLANSHYIVNPPGVSWVIVGGRAAVAVFRKEEHQPLGFVARFQNPVARMRDREIEGLEQASHDFAVKVIHYVDAGRSQGRFEKVVLVAEPHFLGLLRKVMPQPLLELVSQEIQKEVPVTSTAHVEKALEQHWRKINIAA